MSKNLKHGSVSVAGVQDKATRDALMRLNENVAEMARRLDALHRKTEALEKKGKN